ncbi:Uncharacterized protein GBIM_13094 [Gryllus bimaculatus]|nr:Uncharacterized protein GBIM_13094 [Gryllus bimaculatus]
MALAVSAALLDRLRPAERQDPLERGAGAAAVRASYVLCALGLPDVSLSFLSLGALQSLAAATLSLLLQHARRCLAIVVGFVFHACLLLVLMLWKPTGDDPALFYVIAAAWAFIMDLYPDSWQAPLAQCHCFRCVGLAVAFGVHAGICNWVKLYALAGALVLAIGPYAWLEMKLDLRRKNKMDLASL